MAVVNYQDEYLKKLAANQAGSAVNNSASNVYGGMSGISDRTRQMIDQYQQGYKPSQSVTDAQKKVQDIENQKPGEYKSQYQSVLDDLFNQIIGRKDFAYDAMSDPLFKEYSALYQQKGQRAMMDTMGQAAALTGGYGNSYAQAAGQQAYQGYMTELMAQLPALRQQAYAEWQGQGEELQRKYAAGQQADQTAYGRYRDLVADWQAALQSAEQRYQSERQFDYGQYGDQRDYWTGLGQNENQDWWTARNYAYDTVQRITANGQMPSADLLARAGLTEADARAMIVQKSSGGGGGGGGSGKSDPKIRLAGNVNPFNSDDLYHPAAGVDPEDPYGIGTDAYYPKSTVKGSTDYVNTQLKNLDDDTKKAWVEYAKKRLGK